MGAFQAYGASTPPPGLGGKGFFGAAPPKVSSGGPKTWTQLITGFEGAGQPFAFTLDFVNGFFVIGMAGANVLISSDAITWTLHFVNGAVPPAGVTFGASTYVLAQNDAPPFISTSADLITWSSHASSYPSGAILLKPVFGAGVFLTVAANSARYATSTDGAAWTQRSSYVPNAWGQPIFDGTRFLAPVLNASNTPKVVTSTDAIHWSESTATLSAAFNGSGTPFTLGNNGSTLYLAAEQTDDTGNALGNALASASAFTYNNPGFGTLVQPVWSGASWARLNNDTSALHAALCSSSDGATWFLDTIPAIYRTPADLAFGLSQFLSLGYDASSDLIVISRGP